MMDQEHEPRQQRIIYLMGYYNSPSILHLLTFLFVALTLVTCSPSPTTSTEVKVQAALPTPTLEPTFTPLPLPVDKPASPLTTIATVLTVTTASMQASLSGHILDQDSNQPIAGAIVSAGTYSSTSHADGYYTRPICHRASTSCLSPTLTTIRDCRPSSPWLLGRN